MNYDEIGIKIVDYLLLRQNEDGLIIDSIDQRLSVKNHYTQSLFALSAILAYKKNPQEKYLTAAKRALDFFFSMPFDKKGQLEINNFAILSIKNELINSSINFDSSMIDKYIKTIEFFDQRETISNNFIVMKALSLGLLYKITSNSEYLEDMKTLLQKIFLWQKSDGIFYDYPNDTEASNFASPIAYHAKICSFLCLCYELFPDETLLKRIKKGADIIKNLLNKKGETFFFGRANSSILGIISALVCVNKLTSFIKEEIEIIKYKDVEKRLKQYLENQRCADGHIKLVPHKDEQKKFGWEDYFQLSQYNAYCAALLFMLTPFEDIFPEKYNEGFFFANQAGLGSFSQDNLYFSFSTKGQEFLYDSIYFCDTTYAGMQLNYLSYKSDTYICPAPPLSNFTEQEREINPYYSGFIPFLECHAGVYVCKLFTETSAQEESYGIHISGKGKLARYTATSKLYKYIFKFATFLFEKGNLFFDKEILENSIVSYDIFYLKEYQAFVFATSLSSLSEPIKGHASLWNGRFLKSSNPSWTEEKIIFPNGGSFALVGGTYTKQNLVGKTSEIDSAYGKNLIFTVKEKTTITKNQPYVCVSVLKFSAKELPISVEILDEKYKIKVGTTIL